jgi:hypothetical protein
MHIRQALDYAATHCPTCVLCGGESCWAGAWVPPDRLDHLFEQWHGEKQGFAYSLCEDCKTHADIRERVEAKLIARHGQARTNGRA